ncbi:hypothetical protein ACTXT7_016407, partial [Hymenolepis weldensis]
MTLQLPLGRQVTSALLPFPCFTINTSRRHSHHPMEVGERKNSPSFMPPVRFELTTPVNKYAVYKLLQKIAGPNSFKRSLRPSASIQTSCHGHQSIGDLEFRYSNKGTSRGYLAHTLQYDGEHFEESVLQGTIAGYSSCGINRKSFYQQIDGITSCDIFIHFCNEVSQINAKPCILGS